jgi:uncharacterized protein
MAIHRSIPEDLVYRMTRVIYENWDEVLASAPWWDAPGEASLESGPAITTLPYHPGAIRYFEERGVWARYHGGETPLRPGAAAGKDRDRAR